jgi:two-component system nitrate/nitrite response regulator NarL
MKGENMSGDIEVALLSSNGILREGLRHILVERALKVTSAVSDPEKISFPPMMTDGIRHIIIVDDGFAKEGMQLCPRLREQHPGALLVILADHFDFDSVATAFRWGVDGYLVKEISSEPLIGALRLVALGEKVLPSELATCMGERPYASGWTVNLSDVNLSEREMQVLQLLILGSANKVIGRCLGICEATVKVHVKAALRKLQVSNRTQAAIWAVQRGLTGYDSDTPSLPAPAGRGAAWPPAPMIAASAQPLLA